MAIGRSSSSVSPSGLTMPTISTSASGRSPSSGNCTPRPLKVTACTPSKHFFRCGMMRSSDRESERMESSSSFERKKKRGKTLRFVSM